MRVLIKIICCFIPGSENRKKFRQRVRIHTDGSKIARNFKKITKWKYDNTDGIIVASGVVDNKQICLPHVQGEDLTPKCCAFEIFSEGVYHFSQDTEAVVIDIGMNNGFASLYFAMRDDVKKIYAFELVGDIYEKALLTFDLNKQYSTKIIPHNYGLSDNTNQFTIAYNPSHTGGTSSVFKKANAKTNVSVQVEDVADHVRNIIADNPGIKIVIKCDCEGAEKEIFTRLSQTDLLRFVSIIIVEYHRGLDNLLEIIFNENKFAYFNEISWRKKSGRNTGIIRAVNKNQT